MPIFTHNSDYAKIASGDFLIGLSNARMDSLNEIQNMNASYFFLKLFSPALKLNYGILHAETTIWLQGTP